MKQKKVHIQIIKDGLYLNWFLRGERTVRTLKLKNTPENWIIAEEKARDMEERLTLLDDAMSNAGFKKEKFSNRVVQNNIKETQLNKDLKILKEQNAYTFTKCLKDFALQTNQGKKNEDMYRCAIKSFNNANTDLELKEVKPEHYDKWLKYMVDNDKAYATRKTYVNYLGILYDWAKEEKKVNNKNPFKKLEARDKINNTVIPDKHFELIMPVLKEKNIELYNFIYFLRLTGFRLNEALQLRWDKVDFTKKQIIVTNYKKNQNENLFPLKGELLQLMTEMKKSKKDDMIFHLHEQWIRVPFQNAIRTINEKLREEKKPEIEIYKIHDLRRTAISRWANNPEISIMELATLTRHRDIATTKKYYYASDMDKLGDKIF